MSFDTMDDARDTANAWVLRNGWSSKTKRSDRKRTILRCVSQECPFSLKINSSKKGIRLTELIHHTCPSSTHNNWRGKNNIATLSKDPANIGLFLDDPKVKPDHFRRQELRIHGNVISKHTAWKLRQRIKSEQLGDEAKSFQKIPGLLLAMQQGQEGQNSRTTHHFCE